MCFCQETYGSFDYTSLLYLTDYGKDFTGGRFVFVDKDANRTVEPRVGEKNIIVLLLLIDWKYDL